MMKNREFRLGGRRWHGTALALFVTCLISCGEDTPSNDSAEEETLAEYVSRCESFTGNNLADCPEDCAVVESVRILYDGVACEMATDGEGLPVLEDLCIAADQTLEHPYGHRGVYRRVEVGDATDDPVTPSEPEEVRRFKIYGDMQGWERCTEATSDYCGCALQFEVLDG